MRRFKQLIAGRHRDSMQPRQKHAYRKMKQASKFR